MRRMACIAICALAACQPAFHQSTGAVLAVGGGDGVRIGQTPMPGAVTLRAPGGTIPAGTRIGLLLANRTPDWVVFSPCYVQLEREQDGRWHPVMDATGACEAIQRRVPPRGSVRFSATLPVQLEGGRYRYRNSVEVRGEPGGVTVLSNVFRIED